jgi:RNA-directed DNA polymerase
MPVLTYLKTATTRAELAELLGFKPASLAYILFKLPAASKYTTFDIAKRNGGTRTIKAPAKSLKLLQRRLSDLLQDCVDEINLTTKRKDRAAHGFKRKRSIVTNARQHRHRRWTFNIDLEKFFPSINFGRVRGFFIKNTDFGLNEAVATTIAQIACIDNALPQGSPCSPVISNLIASVLDVRLVALAAAAGCTYSRYADDITFSTNKKAFPTQIAIPVPTAGPHAWEPSDDLKNAIERAGFTINASKTRMMYRHSRQEVTGLIVNRKINVRTEYRRTVRAMVHRVIRTGTFDVLRPTQNGSTLVLEKRPGSLNELHGMLGFINGIDVFSKNRDPHDLPEGLRKKEEAYRQFLLYSQFYAAERPVIVCEGDTDNVYLTHAIRSLATNYPNLAEVKKGGKILLKVRLYKYRQSGTARILGLKDGGTGGLKHFINSYREETERFSAPGMMQPVVVLFDNDSGAKAIRSVVKDLTKQQIAPPFLRVVKNLYAVPTPIPTGATESKIEDFFDAAAKAISYNGKTFHDGPEFDRTKHIGKQIFAHRVVRTNASKINFAGFAPLLDSLVAVIHAQ